jgi:hypothetical protein
VARTSNASPLASPALNVLLTVPASVDEPSVANAPLSVERSASMPPASGSCDSVR